MTIEAKLNAILICPHCNAKLGAAPDYACESCGQTFFALQGMPCLFNNGQRQRHYWSHLAALVAAEAEQELAPAHGWQRGLPAASDERGQQLAQARRATKQTIVEILRGAGIEPQRADAEFGELSHQSLLQYFPLLLRDWAWPAAQALDKQWNENSAAMAAVTAALPKRELNGKNVLVIGAGAGRLSWDLHCHAQPALTVALDFNPLLSYCAHALIKQAQSLELPDAQLQPSQGAPRLQYFSARAEGGDAERHQSFIQICADAFNPPLAPGSFDLIITPWFLDICGRDARQLIALVSKLLRPGGHWLNYGPLLYPDTLAPEYHYSPAELRELVTLAEFELEFESEQDQLYLQSPLARRGRWERCWTWRAKAPHSPPVASAINSPLARSPLPPWWVLPHLPVPTLGPDLLPPELANLTQLFDGRRSLHELARQLSPLLPAGHNAEQFLRELLSTYVFVRES